MPTSTPYFADGYMRLLYRFLQLDTAREADFFGTTEVTPEQLLQARPDLPFTLQMQLCRNALALSEPGLGLRIGAQLQLAAHGAVGTAMQNANDLGQALQSFAELGAARASFFKLTIDPGDSSCSLTLEFEGLDTDLLPFFSESILATLRHCLAFYTGSEQMIGELRLEYPAPIYARRYESVFAAAVKFGTAATQLQFPSHCLRMTTHDPDPLVYAEAVGRCRQEIESHTSATNTPAAIEQFLWSNPGKLWRIDELAVALGCSTRTVLRRLKQNKTSYQELRDNVFKQQAALYLGTMSVADTAAALGFAEESSFRRSFKRWYDVTPREFRQLAAARENSTKRS